MVRERNIINGMRNKWKIIEGEIPVLLVAPHNFPHIRNGTRKLRDAGTGLLVEKLCVKTGAWGIISIAIQKDPNWYVDSAFREKLKNIISSNEIKVVIDIHGRRLSWPTLIDAYPNKNFKREFGIKILRNFKVRHFKDDDQLTIIEDLDNLKISGVEIEIRQDGRIKGSKLYNDVINNLRQLINNLL